MSLKFRADQGIAFKKPRRTAEGFLRISGAVVRAGVFSYVQPDGSVRREYRPAEEIAKAESLAQLDLLPVVNGHPPPPVQAIKLDSIKEQMVGMVGSPKFSADDNHVYADFLITDAKTIRDIESGKIELSPGVYVEHDETPGVFNNEPYDVVQRNLTYNHVAVVDRGRQGRSVSLRLDEDGNQTLPNKESVKMKQIKIHGMTFEVDDALAQALGQERDTVQLKIDEAQKATDEAQAKADAAKTELETERKLRVDAEDPKRLVEAVAVRVALEKKAEKVLGSEFKADGKSDREIKIEAIKAAHKDMKIDEAKLESEAYVDVLFDLTVEREANKPNPSLPKAGGAVLTNDGDEDPRAKFIREQNDGWKQPLNNK